MGKTHTTYSDEYNNQAFRAFRLVMFRAVINIVNIVIVVKRSLNHNG